MQAFKNYVEKLVSEARKTKSETILNEAVKYNEGTGIFSYFITIWDQLPEIAKATILNFLLESWKYMTELSHIFVNESVSGIIVKIANLAKYGKLVSITLASSPVVYYVLRSVYPWWNGRMSGQRAGKNIADGFVTVAATYGSRAAGSIQGSGGIPNFHMIGGTTCNIAENKLTQMITNSILDLPKTQALENAYNYINVSHRASDAEVKAAYYRCLRRNHPDKPTGSKEAFCKLQAYIAIIRMARGEIVDEK